MSTTHIDVNIEPDNYLGVRTGHSTDDQIPYVRIANVTLRGDKADLVDLLTAAGARLNALH